MLGDRWDDFWTEDLPPEELEEELGWADCYCYCDAVRSSTRLPSSQLSSPWNVCFVIFPHCIKLIH